MVFRFAVGDPDGSRSNSWKLWHRGEDVSLLQRAMGKVHKFSFHKSGICRWAQIEERADGSDRAILKWSRDPVPEAGGSLFISLVFPTNHLSSQGAKNADKVYWIEPAPTGYAIKVEILVTNEEWATINDLFGKRGERKLVFCQALRNGAHVCAVVSEFDCGPVDLRVPEKPTKPGQVFGDLAFPDLDKEGAGRPVRMLLMPSQRLPPTVWELGGYEISKLR